MDVGSNNPYPAGALSNFTANTFVVDGVKCGSMEGFLQGLKFKSKDMQAEICTYIGFGAKKAGAKKNWQTTQTLWWKGVSIPRKSEKYQLLITAAYDAMFEQSPKFKNALRAAGKDAVFTHSIGRRNEAETVLTEREFCSQLMRLKRKMFEID
jgi:predicted NAD-dependent protein-ADP-ribosyltransferase YbiA (DUF1768 family)